MASHLHNYIYDCDIKTNSVDDCYNYFNTNTDYTIDNLDAELENRIYIGSHDNREIHIKFPKNVDYSYPIHRLLKKRVLGYFLWRKQRTRILSYNQRESALPKYQFNQRSTKLFQEPVLCFLDFSSYSKTKVIQSDFFFTFFSILTLSFASPHCESATCPR